MSILQNKYIRLLIIFLSVYFFLVSISLITASFELFGSGFAEQLMQTTSNPFVALFIGIIATSLIQSSSVTTSIIVGMVASGALPFPAAIPMIMGANVGTTVTNMIVSLGHASRRKEFGLAFAGATQHDFFNLLAIVIFLPLELVFHIIENASLFLTSSFEGIGGITFVSPIKMVVHPMSDFLVAALNSNPLIIIIAALVILFLALKFIVSNTRVLIAPKAATILDSKIFGHDFSILTFGILLTAVVQSSSITTSLVIPLIAAGVVSLNKAFPYMLGSNIGTTVTAFLAALAIGTPLAIAVSIAHFLFNIFGTVVIYPFRKIPIGLARWFGKVASRRRRYALLYVLCAFYLIPLAIILLTGGG